MEYVWSIVYLLSILSFPILSWLAWKCGVKRNMGLLPDENPDFLTFWKDDLSR